MTMPMMPSHEDRRRLRERHAGQQAPCTGQRVAEMLPDGHAEIAVERLEDDIHGVTSGGARLGVGGGACEEGTRNGQRMSPRNCAAAASTPTVVPTASKVPSASLRARERTTTSGAKSTAARAKAPPHHHERGAAFAVALEDVVGGPAQGVGVVESRRQQSE
jgi:hypothetical protein